MSKQKKTFEINFGMVLFIIIIICVVIYTIGRYSGNIKLGENSDNSSETEQSTEYTETNIYSNNVIMLDIGKLSDKWQVVEKQNGSIIYYIQGPSNQKEDGTTDDIRINVYLEKSDMSNEEMKTQLLEHSIYSSIEYTKTQLIDDVQWREFEAGNKGIKAKILAVMQDGYMHAIEIVGEENLYNQYYNEAMRTAMTIQIASKIPDDVASDVIYNYTNLADIKTGGTQYLLNSLSLPQTIENTNETLPAEYVDYKFTGISYSDFENAMTKYMTLDVLKSQFSEFINYNGTLYMKDITGTQTDYMIEDIKVKNIKGQETTYEITKQNMNTFIRLIQNITLKYENGVCVVSNVEA